MKVSGIRGEVYLHITEDRERSFGWDRKKRRFEPGKEYKAIKNQRNRWSGHPITCGWGMHGSKNTLFFCPKLWSWVSVVRIWGDVDDHDPDKVAGRRRKYIATRQIKTVNSQRMLKNLSCEGEGTKIAQWVLAKPYNGIIAAGYHPRKR